jgi:hypothetical protein
MLMQSSKCIPSSHNPLVNSVLHQKPRKDDNVMDTNATYMSIASGLLTLAQCKEWSDKMKGRCFACTSSSHSVKDCCFCKDGAKCSWCTRLGHTQAACLQHFASCPQGPPPPCQHLVNAAHLDEVDSGEESGFDLGVASMKPEAPKSDDETPAMSISATTLALG